MLGGRGNRALKKELLAVYGGPPVRQTWLREVIIPFQPRGLMSREIYLQSDVDRLIEDGPRASDLG